MGTQPCWHKDALGSLNERTLRRVAAQSEQNQNGSDYSHISGGCLYPDTTQRWLTSMEPTLIDELSGGAKGQSMMAGKVKVADAEGFLIFARILPVATQKRDHCRPACWHIAKTWYRYPVACAARVKSD